MDRPLALVIEPDPAARAHIIEALARREVDVLVASAEDSVDVLRSRPLSLVVFDPEAPGVNARELMEAVGSSSPSAVFVGIADVAVRERAPSLVGSGLFDVLFKPVDGGRLELVVSRALRQSSLLEELGSLRENLRNRDGARGIVGSSSRTERLREQLARLADTDDPVWFHGEPGSGKEHAARALHRLSRRSLAAIEVVECSELAPDTWRSRLGLDAEGLPRAGELYSNLHGGAIYLREPAALPPELQSSLLTTLAAASARGIDVRVMAASTEVPEALLAQGRILESLARRLATHPVAVPALRDRASDIALLARHFIATICAMNRLPSIVLAPDASKLLEAHRWPENVDGLRNVIEQAVIVSPDGHIRPRDLPAAVREAVPSAALFEAGSGTLASRPFREAKGEVVGKFERAYLRELMGRHRGNVTAAAQHAGMLRSALQRLLRKYGLKSADFRHDRAARRTEDSARAQR